MVNNELFLTTIPAKSGEYKLIGSSWKMLFPVLSKKITDKNIYEVLHIINMNKIYERDSGFIIEDSRDSYEKLVEMYKDKIQKLNDELLSKYNNEYNDFNAECIIKPQSSNDWLYRLWVEGSGNNDNL